MNCTYYYKNQKFDNELKLDDFLLDNSETLIDTFGDEVFSERDLGQIDNINAAEKVSFQSWKLKQNKKEKSISYNSVFETNEGSYNNAIAVTQFLEGLKVKRRGATEAKYLFPKFIEEEYFNHRITEWREGKFSEKEKEDFKDEPEFKDNKIPTIINKELIDRLVKIEKEKWDNEAKIGTAIHRICEIFFSRYDFNKENKNFGIWGDKENREILNQIDKYGGELVDKYLTPEIKENVINYCRKLRKTIEGRYGESPENFVYYPELRLEGRAIHPQTGDETNLIGTIDLLVIPPKGKPFIVDYKVSPADYYTEAERDIPIEQLEPHAYSRAKKLAFKYQLATYGRMIKQKNDIFDGLSLCVAPIQLLNFRRDDNEWKFDKINTDVNLLDNLSLGEELMEVQSNLDNIFLDISATSLSDKEILQRISTQIEQWFVEYLNKRGEWDLQDVANLIENPKNKYKENLENSNEELRYSYLVFNKPIYGKNKEQLIMNVHKELNSYSKKISWTVHQFKEIISHKIDVDSGFSNILEHKGGDTDYYKKLLRKYSRGHYTVIENLPKAFDLLGIVLLKNDFSGNIEVVKLTNSQMSRKVDRYNKNKLITQCFADDIVDKSGKNYLLDAVQGNVEMIETLLALNLIPRVIQREKAKIHSIQVVNPYINSGITATNKQLLYAYKTLLKYKNLDPAFGKDNLYYAGHTNGVIKFCTLAEQALDTLRTGYRLAVQNKGEKASENVITVRNKCLNPLEEIFLNNDMQNLESTLYDAIIDLHEIYGKTLTERQLTEIDFETSPEQIQVQYQALLRAYAESIGYDFKQQVEELSNLGDNVNIFLYGHSGLRTDNPGTTASDNLNKVTEFIENCYKRVTDTMQRPHAKVQKLVTKLKKDRHISYLADSTFANSIKIYDNMTNLKNRNPGDDWLFVNPYSEDVRLTDTEREFLKYIIKGINKDRFGQRGESDIDFEKRLIQNLNNNSIEWLRVPLAYKGTQGKLEVQGLIAAAKDYFKSWMPKEVKSRMQKEMSHLLDENGRQNKDDVYRMRTIFDQGEGDHRVEMLEEIEMYDHDLQSVFLKHLFGYTMKRESENAFILTKAAYGDILLQEFSQNRDNSQEKQYLTDNIRIMTGQKLMSDKELLIYEYAKKIMKAASVATLGFNPKMIYQNLEGIYKDIGILVRAEDGEYTFSFKHLVQAFCNVYKELTKFGYQPTKLERLNQLYRINDMDINVYAQHLQNSHNIIRDFQSFLFRFASRPDFYNRMTIFEAYMRGDGTYDAYKLNADGELEYHFEDDLRFTALVKGDTSDPKYREQEALYRAMARQFEIEGAIYPDGTKFKLEPPTKGVYKALPQAYTNKQAHSYKAMADKLYGYYSHEKKALMQSSLLGALFWQMNTYWSGKKNQWFAISSVKDRGYFTHYSEVELDENGQPIIQNGKEKRKYFYYQVDEDGTIHWDTVVPENQLKNKEIIIPFIQWEGMFSEGIAVTLASMVYDSCALFMSDRNNLIQTKGSNYNELFSDGEYTKDISKIFSTVRDQYWNNANENLRRAYRQNIKQFAFDLSVLSIMGGLIGGQIHLFVNDYTNDHKDDHNIQQAMTNSALALAEAIFDSSTMDFNPFESLGGRGVNWTPFAISTITRTAKIWSKVLTGDNSLIDGMLKTFSLNRFTLKPFLETIHDPEVVDHEGPEPTQEEQRNAVAEAMTLMSLSPIYTQ